MQAGSLPCPALPCLVLSSCDCMCDEPLHGEGGGAKPPKRTSFFLGSSNRIGQGGESFYKFNIYTYIRARARASGTGRGRIRNGNRWSLLFFVDSMRVEERLVGR